MSKNWDMIRIFESVNKTTIQKKESDKQKLNEGINFAPEWAFNTLLEMYQRYFEANDPQQEEEIKEEIIQYLTGRM